MKEVIAIKLLLFTDLHLGEKKYNTIEEEFEHYDFIFNQIQDIITAHKVDSVIFLGDMFHSVLSLSLPVLVYLKDRLSRFSQFTNIVLLSGNHDQKDTSRNQQLLSIFADKNIDIISSSYYHYFSSLNVGLFFVSFMNNQSLYSMINNVKSSNIVNFDAENFLFGHFALYPESYSLYKTYNAISYDKTADFFSKFKYIFLGHIHSLSSFSNVVYLGSAVYHNFQDSAVLFDEVFTLQPRYAYILDITSNNTKIEPIELQQDEYFITLYSDKIYDENYKNSYTSFLNSHPNVNCRIILNDVNDYSSFISDLKKHVNVKKIKIETNIKSAAAFNLDKTNFDLTDIHSIDSKKMILDSINNDKLITDENIRNKIISELQLLYSKI